MARCLCVPWKRNKYGNEPVIVNGIRFDSKLEAKRYQTLAVMERHGEIMDLTVHPCWTLDVNGIHICDYEADFGYARDGELVVEDVKSSPTSKLSAYRIKRRLMKALYGIEVKEI